MRLNLHVKPARIGTVLACIALFLAAQSLFAEYALSTIIGMESQSVAAEILDLFSVNLEDSIPTWYATILLFLAAGVLTWIAVVKRMAREPYALHWLGLAALFTYLSIDEGSAIHEIASGPIRTALGTSGFLEFGWLVVGVPFLLLVSLVYLRFVLHLPPRTRSLVVAAAAVYVCGAVVIESISAREYSVNRSSMLYLGIATVEETFEMLGIVLFIYALLDYAVRHNYTLWLQPAVGTGADPHRRPLRRGPLIRAGVAFGILLFSLNTALLVWGVTSPERNAAVEETAALVDTAPYHYFVIVDSLVGNDVTVSHLAGTFPPAGDTMRRTVNALLDIYANVQVLSLPALNASIVIASDTFAFAADDLTDLMQSIGETQYIFYDTPTVQALAALF